MCQNLKNWTKVQWKISLDPIRVTLCLLIDTLFGQRTSGFKQTMILIQNSDIDAIDENYRAALVKRMIQISFNLCRGG